MKRFIVIFTILLVLFTLFISVSAADFSVSILSGPNDQILSLNSNDKVDIFCSVTLSNDNYNSCVWQYSYDLVNWTNFLNDYGEPIYGLQRYISFDPLDDTFYIRARVIDRNSQPLFSRTALIEVSPASFSNFVSSSLRYVISWVGSIVSSLTEGSLSGLLPVLAIGIAVGFLLLVVKIVKFFGWGA